MTTSEFLASCLLLWNSAACSHSRGSKSNNSSIQRGEKGLLTARFFGDCARDVLLLSLESLSVIPCQIEFGCMDSVFRFGFLSNIYLTYKKLLEHVTSQRRMNPIWKQKTALEIGSSWWRQIGYIPWDHLVPFSAASFIWWFSCQFLDVEVM